MKYTFEITVAGCATNCAHCYVAGGPGPIMPYEDYVFCLKRLVPALERLSEDVALNLGNETFCHPRAADLFRLTDRMCPQFFDRRGEDFPTTGVALLRHRERTAILQELHRKGITELFFAVHGGRKAHDQIVGFPGRFDQLFETAAFLTGQGFRVGFSLMLSRMLFSGFDEVMDCILRYPGANVYPTIPFFCPTPRLRAYQRYRLEAAELLSLCSRLDDYGLNTSVIRTQCNICSEQAVWQTPRDLTQEYAAAPKWAFFHITHDLQLYYGNAGMHTRYLGNLCWMDSQEIYQAIAPLGPNYDFDAFYPMNAFDRLTDIPKPVTNRVYASRPECYYAWLDQLGVKSSLLK